MLQISLSALIYLTATNLDVLYFYFCSIENIFKTFFLKIPLLKIFNLCIWKAERHRGDWEREHFHLLAHSPNAHNNLGLGLSSSQELGTEPRFPHGLQEPNYLSHHHFSQGWHEQEAGMRTQSWDSNLRPPTWDAGILAMRLNVYNWNFPFDLWPRSYVECATSFPKTWMFSSYLVVIEP